MFLKIPSEDDTVVDVAAADAAAVTPSCLVRAYVVIPLSTWPRLTQLQSLLALLVRAYVVF